MTTLKILHICDTPEDLIDLGDLKDQKLDAVFTSGDLPRAIYDRIKRELGNLPLYGVKGNHDSPTDLSVDEDLHLRVVDFHGVKLGGFQGSWRYKPRGLYLYSENEVQVSLSNYPPVDIFVAHNPPALEGHEVQDDVHNGFNAFVDYCGRSNVKYLFHGHTRIEKDSSMGETRVFCSYGRRVIEIEL